MKKKKVLAITQTKEQNVSSIPVDTSTDSPDYTLVVKTCKVLYDDDKWNEGTITGCEKYENVWKFHFQMENSLMQPEMILK